MQAYRAQIALGIALLAAGFAWWLGARAMDWLGHGELTLLGRVLLVFAVLGLCERFGPEP
jgi:hypothetical protein